MFDIILLLVNILFHKNMLYYIFVIILSYNISLWHGTMYVYLLPTPSTHSCLSIPVTRIFCVKLWTTSSHHNKIFKNVNPMQENTSFLCMSHVKLCMELVDHEIKVIIS